MNIFELNAELQNLVEQLEDNGGELTPELEEQLVINQSDVNEKVRSYTEIVHRLESDIELADSETKRLAEIKKIKKNTIERIKKLILYAIDNFGTTSKSGTKFIDFGTGKVSTRKSVSVEVDDDVYGNVADIFRRAVNWAGYTNQPESIDTLYSDIIEKCKDYKENDDDIFGVDLKVTDDDFDPFSMDVTFSVRLDDVKDESVLPLLKELARTRFNRIKVEPKVDKMMLKSMLVSEDNNLNHSKLNEKQNVIIK